MEEKVIKIKSKEKVKSKETKSVREEVELIDYKLRDYQRMQYQFIEDRIDIANVIGIEANTGSGKSITMLKFVKDWLNNPDHALSNVVISTGFNNLVFLMEKRCREFGLTPRILIGTKAINCPAYMSDEDVSNLVVFSENDKCRCGNEHKKLDMTTDDPSKKECPYKRELYKQYVNEIINNVGQVIITNHSSLLVHQDKFKNCSLLIIDEAHTFADFYESYLRLELDKGDLEQLDKAIDSLKPPMNMIVKMNMKNGVDLPEKQIDAICNNIKNELLCNKVREFFETKPDISNYIEMNNYGPNPSYTIDHFYRSFNLSIDPKIILFSATLDDFTLNMFNVRQSNIYRERKTFCDYSKSELLLVPSDDYITSVTDFVNYVNSKNLKHGLILSTTNENVRKTLQLDGIDGYKIFDNLQEFNNYRMNYEIEHNGKKCKAILTGSRIFFQGVDIENLDFVCLDKLPFPVYNERFQAQQAYLEAGDKDFSSWTEFVIPKVENSLTQASGRLWRNPNSKGIIGLFDPRAEGRFKYIVRHVFDRYRHGIQTKILNTNELTGDKIVTNFILNENKWRN